MKALPLEPERLLVVAALLLLVLILAGVLIIGRLVWTDKGDSVLLIGPCGAGKTSLFFQLRDGQLHNGTFTSMEPNDGTFELHGEKADRVKRVRVVDVPGHPRLRPVLQRFMPAARAVVFVVDAADFLPTARSTAELLYAVLRDPAIARRRVPLLVVANKADRPQAHTADFVRKRLEKEIEQLRSTAGALADTQGGSEVEPVPLAPKGKAFGFGASPSGGAAVEASAASGKGLLEIKAFVRMHIRP